MKIKISKIVFLEEKSEPKIEVVVNFAEEGIFNAWRAAITVYLDWKDYTIKEIKTEAVKKAKEFLTEASAK